MQKIRPTVQEAYLKKAKTMGEDYYQKVEIGGKKYFVMVLQGGDLSRMQPHDTEKLRDLSEAFFSAHQGASEANLNDSDITHIDSTGIHFREAETKVSSETWIDKKTENLLMKDFDSEKASIIQHFVQDKPDPIAKEAVPEQFRPYLHKEDEDMDGLYDGDSIDDAIERYALSRLNRIKDLVVSANPASREKIDRRFEEINEDADTIDDLLDQACAALKQHMTAQTVWKAMMNVLLPEQVVLVRSSEEKDVLLVPDPEVEFTNYFICRKTRDALNTLGQDSLTQGVNLVHEGITYNVKMLATQTEEGNHSILIFRAYTKDALLIYTRWKLGFQKTPEAQISMETISDNLKTKGWGILMKESIGVVRANTESESAITLFPMIYDGAVIDGDVETPVFAGTLSAKATEVFKRHPELAPDQPPAYSRKQTAFAFLVSVLALTTVGYGIHKVRKGDITFPTRKEIADFLSKTKANASEYLSQLRQKKPQEGVKA